jgi:hypothetical protein
MYVYAQRYRRDTAVLMEEVCKELKVDWQTRTTAQFYFHYFFAQHSFKRHSRFNVAIACVFLAAKVFVCVLFFSFLFFCSLFLFHLLVIGKNVILFHSTQRIDAYI